MACGISGRQGEVHGKRGLATMPGATPVRRLAVPVTANVAKRDHHRAGRVKTNRAVLRKRIVTKNPAGDLR